MLKRIKNKSFHCVKWSIFIRTNEGYNTFELQTRKEINYSVSWKVRRITAPNGSLRHGFNQSPRHYLVFSEKHCSWNDCNLSGLGMPGLQGSFKFADADDGLQKWILVLSPSKVSQFWIDGISLYNWYLYNEMGTLVLNLFHQKLTTVAGFVTKMDHILLKWTEPSGNGLKDGWKQLSIQGMKLESVFQNVVSMLILSKLWTAASCKLSKIWLIRFVWPTCHLKSPVKRTDFSLETSNNITEPGQWPAVIRVTVRVWVSSPSNETFNVVSLSESRGIIYGVQWT